MGQTPSNPTIATPSITRYSPKYHVIESKQDPHYGGVKIIVEDETKEQQILKEITFSSQEAFDKELDYFTQRVQVSHPNIASILGFSSENDNNKTPHSLTVKIFIEMLEKDLQQELQERIQAKQFYTENELLFICENIISALYHLETKGFSHGDIRPFNIFASSKGYKLFDPSLSSQNEQSALATAINSGLKVFLSPELLAQVPEKNQTINCNKFKADVYSVGITLLSLASLTNGEDLYDYETGQINDKLLQERLSSVKSHYSAFTYDLIMDMLIDEEAKRPDFKDLHTKLLPYQDNIHQKIDLPFFKTKEKQGLQTDKENMRGVNKANLFKGGEVKSDVLKGGDLKQGPIQEPIREFDYQYTRLIEKENVKMGGSHKGTEDIQYTKKSKKSRNKKRKNQKKEVPKTGSILINPDDVLPSQKENLHVDPKTGETYANLKPSGQIEEEKEIEHAPESQEVEKGQGEIQPPSEDIQERDVKEIEYERTDTEEPLKTGGIIIKPEDALPSEREHLHVDPQTGEAYAMLKSGSQIKEQQHGIVHASESQENKKSQEDKQSFESEVKEIEYQRADTEEPLKTGGIIIKPEDALPSERDHLHVDPQTGEAYAMLKSGTQIKEQQAGIVHAPESQEKQKSQEDKQSLKQSFESGVREFDYTRAGTADTVEPLKTGGIVIRPEDALPSEREHLHVDPKTGEAYALLKSGSQIKEQQHGIVHASKSLDDKQSFESEVKEIEYQRADTEEPLKTGGIVIRPEDALPSEREHLHANPQTGEAYAMLKSGTQIKEQQAGIVHAAEPKERQKNQEEAQEGRTREFEYDYVRLNTEEDPLKTGGIIIRPEDALPSELENLHVDPQTGEAYALLKSGTQIQEEQSGIVHASASQKSQEDKQSFESGEEDIEYHRIETEEPLKTGGIVIRPEDALPSEREHLHADPRTGEAYVLLKSSTEIKKQQAGIVHAAEPQGQYRDQREAQGTMSKDFDYQYRIPSADQDPIKTGGIVIRPEDALPSEREHLHADPRTGEAYVLLKSGSQIKDEQGGIVHAPREMREEEKFEEIPSSDKFYSAPIGVDMGPSHVSSRQFVYAYSRNIYEEDPVKTGGIIINPADAHGTCRSEIRTDPRTHYSYVRLKPWSQIQREQSGIVHQLPPHHLGKLEEFEHLSKHKKLCHKYEETKTLSLEEISIDRSQLEISQGYNGTKQVRLVGQFDYQPSKPVEDQNIRIVQPTRYMYPEDMLPPRRMFSEREEELRYDNPRQNEAELFELRPTDTSNATRTMSRASYYEYYRPSVQEEPIKTGGVVIRPEDALSTRRMDINNFRGVSYAVLKPWTQIRAEQGGIIHNAVPRPTNIISRKGTKKVEQMPIFSEERKIEQDYIREAQREPIKESLKTRTKRPNVAQTQDKENISTIANFEKLGKQTDNILKPQGFGLMSQFGNIPEPQSSEKSDFFSLSQSQNIGDIGSEADYMEKQEENRNRLTELDNKLDNLLRRSRVILGESNVMNNLLI